MHHHPGARALLACTLAIVAVAALGLGPTAAVAQTPSDDPESVLRRYADALNRGDVDAAAALHADAAVLFSGDCWPCITPQAVRNDIATDVQHQVHDTLLDVQVSGDAATGRFAITSDLTPRLSGAGIGRWIVVTRIQVQGGKIVRRDDRLDVGDTQTLRFQRLGEIKTQDNLRLGDQNPQTIATFFALYGDAAPDRWRAEHDAQIGHPDSASAQGQPAASGAPAAPADVFRAYADAQNRGDVAAAVALLAPDVRIESPGCGPCVVRSIAESNIQQNVALHTQLALEDVSADGDRVTAHVLVTSDFTRMLAPMGIDHLAFVERVSVTQGVIAFDSVQADVSDAATRRFYRTPQVLADDGQSLADQGVPTLASFYALYGDAAPDHWVAEHNAKLHRG